ncbi:MAG: ribonuclease III [bacterium]
MLENDNFYETPSEFKTRLSLPFEDDFLLIRALTHRSFLNENKSALEDNERLEYLGDAILNFVVAEWIYHKYPEKPEGELTRLRAALVHTEQLASFARMIDMGPALRLGRGEIQAGGRERSAILCDAFEAFIAALYLHGGLSAVKDFVQPLIGKVVDQILANHFDEDPKSNLQEWAQAKGFPSPAYVQIAESGPDHAKTFIMQVFIDGRVFGQGSGSSKQIAEKEAAKQAINTLGLME